MKTNRERRTRLMGVTGEELVPHGQNRASREVQRFGLLTHMPPVARSLLQYISVG